MLPQASASPPRGHAPFDDKEEAQAPPAQGQSLAHSMSPVLTPLTLLAESKAKAAGADLQPFA
jgi:hypothetical protein